MVVLAAWAVMSLQAWAVVALQVLGVVNLATSLAYLTILLQLPGELDKALDEQEDRVPAGIWAWTSALICALSAAQGWWWTASGFGCRALLHQFIHRKLQARDAELLLEERDAGAR